MKNPSHEMIKHNLGWRPDLENTEIRPGGHENLEKQVLFNGKP